MRKPLGINKSIIFIPPVVNKVNEDCLESRQKQAEKESLRKIKKPLARERAIGILFVFFRNGGRKD